MDEKEFLAGLNRKEERAWKELYDYFYSPLCVYSSRVAGDGTAAEDIVQDCLVKLWHSTVCFEEMKVLTSYLSVPCHVERDEGAGTGATVARAVDGGGDGGRGGAGGGFGGGDDYAVL